MAAGVLCGEMLDDGQGSVRIHGVNRKTCARRIADVGQRSGARNSTTADRDCQEAKCDRIADQALHASSQARKKCPRPFFRNQFYPIIIRADRNLPLSRAAIQGNFPISDCEILLYPMHFRLSGPDSSLMTHPAAPRPIRLAQPFPAPAACSGEGAELQNTSAEVEGLGTASGCRRDAGPGLAAGKRHDHSGVLSADSQRPAGRLQSEVESRTGDGTG